MKVLLITQHFDIVGGSDVMVHQTKRLLQQAGHEVEIFAARGPDQPDDGIYPGADHFYRPSPTTIGRFLYSGQARKRLDALLDRFPADVAHLHIHYGTLTSSILAPLRRRNVRIVQHLHEYRSFCSVYTAQRGGETCLDCRVGSYFPGLKHRCNQGSLLRSLISTSEMYVADRLGAKSAPDQFLAVSHFQRQMIVDQGLPADRIATLYNPVDNMFFPDQIPDMADRHGVLFVGRIEAYKGVFDLLDVAQTLPDTRFTFVGDGSARGDLEQRAQGLANVHILGKLDRADVIPHLLGHRMMVVPSRWHETFGLTAVEAMATGCVPIVTRMGGLPEVVQDQTAGFVVEMGDKTQMRTRISELHSDDGLATDMSAQAHLRARDTFSEDQYLGALLGWYRETAQ